MSTQQLHTLIKRKNQTVLLKKGIPATRKMGWDTGDLRLLATKDNSIVETLGVHASVKQAVGIRTPTGGRRFVHINDLVFPDPKEMEVKKPSPKRFDVKDLVL